MSTQSTQPKWRTVLFAIAGLVVLVVVGGVFWLSTVPNPIAPKLPAGFTQTPASPPTVEELMVVDGENRLFIPDLKISAAIASNPVYQDSSGMILPPDDPMIVATVAGGSSQNASEGTWLLTGHVQTVDVAMGALWRLADVTPGELIATTDSSGTPTWWQVTELVSVPKDSFPFSRVTVSGPRYLWIITCGGPGQTHNVIAIAQPVEKEN